jgi:hypothetical protein
MSATPLSIPDFYAQVLPAQGVYCLVHLPGGKRHLWANSREDLCNQTNEHAGTAPGWYFATATFKTEGTERGGRTKGNVTAKRSFHLDIDAGEEKFSKSSKGCYPTREEARGACNRFCAATGIYANILVSSGEGWHLYFTLTEDVTPDVWEPVAKKLGRLAAARGLKVDSTCTMDYSRLLRPPGGIHKNGKAVLAVMATREGRTIPPYSLAAFEALLDEQIAKTLAPMPDTAPARVRLSVSGDVLAPIPPRSAHDIKRHCAFLREFEATGMRDSEPKWVSALSIVKCTPEGEPLAHEWSAKDDRYDETETQKKLDCREGAHSCAVVAQHCEACATCPHFASNGTPLTAGLHSPAPDDADTAYLDTLVNLDPLAFDRKLKEAATTLGVSTSAVKAAVKQRRALLAEYPADEEAPFDEVEPWQEPVDGATLLTEVLKLIKHHIICTGETAIAATLWVVFTWFIDAAQVAPIANITAPEKRCGKTQLLTLMGKLVRRPLTASNTTPAALFRAIEAWHPTMLIDEADAFLRDNEELRGVINSGHTRDSAFVLRTVGDDFTPKRFNTWGAKVLCGIGRIAETLADRSIPLELRRKKPNESIARLRHTTETVFETLRQKLARFAADNMGAVKTARPALPEALNDREQDNWEPLLCIADLAGERWAQGARTTALRISRKTDNTASLGVDLLTCIREVFERRKETRINTQTLITELCADTFEEYPWATFNKGKWISARQVAKRLSDFGIKPKVHRVGADTGRGYLSADFGDAFERYLCAQEEAEKSAR